MPLKLSAHQSLAVDNAALALPVADRDAFYQAVADQLAGREIGDGSVHRAVAAAFHTFWRPPDLNRAPSRWHGGAPRFEHNSEL